MDSKAQSCSQQWLQDCASVKHLTAHVTGLSEVELSIVAAALPALRRLLDLVKRADEGS